MHIARMKFVHTSLFRLNKSGSLVYVTQTDLNSLLIQDTVPTTPFIYFCPYPNSIFPFKFSIHDSISILPIIKKTNMFFVFIFIIIKILLAYNTNNIISIYDNSISMYAGADPLMGRVGP
jgi:hypothetical protein